MPQRTPQRKLALAFGVIIAFALLSGALSQIALAPGLRIESRMADAIDYAFTVQERTPNPLGGEFVGLIVSIVSGLAIILFIVGLLRRESRLSTIMAIVVGAALAVLLSGLVTRPERFTPPTEEELAARSEGGNIGAAETLAEEDAVVEGAAREPVSWFWSLLVIGPAMAGILLVLRPYLRRPTRPKWSEAGEVARDAADAIASGQELADVIQRCYRDMVRAIEQSTSVKRRSSMTPREFESRLRVLGVEAEDVRALTRLFENSRYGASSTQPENEAAAVAHLRRIAEAIGGSESA